MFLQLTIWDILLLVAVSVMGTVLAYLHNPQWKAMVLTLPIPFSMAFLSVGQPVDVTNVAGLMALLGFTHLVRILYYDKNVRIIPTIVVSAIGYGLAGTLLAKLLPKTDAMFWIVFAAVMLVGTGFYLWQPIRNDRGHRTTLPVWLKLPIIVTVILLLILAKKNLQGFMTVFPMVGVIAAYEGRFSLWTNCHKIALTMIAMGPAMAAMYIAQHYCHQPPGIALAIGWAVLLSILLPLSREIWSLPAWESSSHGQEKATEPA